MSRLVDAYRAALADKDVQPGDTEALDAAIATLYRRGKERHLSIAIDEVTFAAHLARCHAPILTVPESRIHACDLFLACGVLNGRQSATTILVNDYASVIDRYLWHIVKGATAREDLAQTVWSALLLGDSSRGPRLARYSGAGALAGFLGVCAQRIALTDHERHAVRKALTAAAEQRVAVVRDAELDLLRERFRDELEAALRKVLEGLDDRSRIILRMRIVDGVSVAAIAKAYQVGQATMSRWIEKLRGQLRHDVSLMLRDRLSVTDGDFEASPTLLSDKLDLSLSRILRPTG